ARSAGERQLELGPDYPVTSLNDGGASARGWSAGGGWASAADDAAPYVEIAFHGLQTIDSVDFTTLQDDWQNPGSVSNTTTFSLYGITAFRVDAWSGSAWVTLAT